MIDSAEPTVRKAVITILAAIYETGFVDEVDLGLVLQLFGLPSDPDAPIVSFTDQEWIEQYIQFKHESMGEEFDEISVIKLDDDDPQAQSLKELLSDMGVIPEDDGELSEEDDLSDHGPKPGESIH